MKIPSHLEWWREEPGGAEWLAALPTLAAELAEQWSLRLGEPFGSGNASLAVPAERADGALAVLKINFPEAETEREADALALWDGRGTVRLLARDDTRRALLVERCVPGTSLWELDDEDEANAVAADVLRRIWHPAPPQHPFRLLGDEAERWADEIPRDWEAAGRPFERELVDAAVGALRELGPSQGELVVCHQDFQGSNVLRAEREPWLAIDPKPIVGEREFDLASLLRDRRWSLGEPGAADRVRRRVDMLTSELGLDRERARGWAIAHAIAWGLEPTSYEPEHVEAVRLLRRAA